MISKILAAVDLINNVIKTVSAVVTWFRDWLDEYRNEKDQKFINDIKYKNKILTAELERAKNNADIRRAWRKRYAK